MRKPVKHSFTESVNFAIQGIITALRSERNMKIHAFVTIIVVIASMLFNLEKMEIISLFIAITFVWCAEMLNTAVEAVVDIVCKRYHPLAKKAKDVAAGAVFVTAINASAIGYLVFRDKIFGAKLIFIDRLKETDWIVMVLSIIVILVITIKTIHNKGTPLMGGMPSGHSALAFSVWTFVLFLTDNVAIITSTFILAFLTAQSRIDGKIHTFQEVLFGSALGFSVTFVILKLFLNF